MLSMITFGAVLQIRTLILYHWKVTQHALDARVSQAKLFLLSEERFQQGYSECLVNINLHFILDISMP